MNPIGIAGKIVYPFAMKTSLILFIALQLAACSTPPAINSQAVPVAPGVNFSLLSPADLGRPIDAVQLVTAHHGSDTFVIEGRLSVTPDQILMVGTDPLGNRIMSVRWSNHILTVDKASWVPDILHPENILADVMMTYWPEASVRHGLSGASLEATPERHIQTNGKDVVVISYDGDPWSGTTHLKNLAWDYQIDVKSSMVIP